MDLDLDGAESPAGRYRAVCRAYSVEAMGGRCVASRVPKKVRCRRLRYGGRESLPRKQGYEAVEDSSVLRAVRSISGNKIPWSNTVGGCCQGPSRERANEGSAQNALCLRMVARAQSDCCA